ncbi:hypothetical protein GIJ44_22280 [Staphylococcus sp. KY49P]|uniref:Uncharacterized protein n=1 Tax=Staphylococcus xylosus TaxID=1288 RepID=A0A2H4UFR1_STAXY|nr:hypothetical protein [Staphylococcus xylosus]ATZ72080.1 hypothetical protein [Staphylococcus xylosus]MBF0813305.1 hypothetical protein [Staphylococcus saprophyticus]MRF37410.1 hypothetical protein [Staphylococcus sp. KY49P]TFV23978.1 hypothetical protein E4T75_06195 [Staphylococcus saprophyticus]
MTNDPQEAYNHFAHLNKFLKKEQDYRHQDNARYDKVSSMQTVEDNIYKKSKSTIKQKGHI